MKLSDFIQDFAENYSVQNIEDINGVIVAPINTEYYLVSNREVKK